MEGCRWRRIIYFFTGAVQTTYSSQLGRACVPCTCRRVDFRVCLFCTANNLICLTFRIIGRPTFIIFLKPGHMAANVFHTNGEPSEILFVFSFTFIWRNCLTHYIVSALGKLFLVKSRFVIFKMQESFSSSSSLHHGDLIIMLCSVEYQYFVTVWTYAVELSSRQDVYLFLNDQL